MMWGVVWYGKWKGGLAKCVDKAVGERMVGGRYVCSMGCLGGVVKTK